MPDTQLRPLCTEDLPQVFTLQCRAHEASYHEPVESLASRLALGTQSCFVLERKGQLIAYVLAHPWAGEPAPLHQSPRACVAPDHLFIHDLVVCPLRRGNQAAQRLVRAVTHAAQTQGFTHLQLVALARAKNFWIKQGFEPSPDINLSADYGQASLMQRRIGHVSQS